VALSLLTNVVSLGAQRSTAQTQNRLYSSMQRLSSGKRINQSGDDAAGLSITSKMSAHIRSLSQVQRNAQDAISFIQTAEGAYKEVGDLLSRIRELGVQAMTDGTITNTDRSALDQERIALESEIDRIAVTTLYNGESLLNQNATVDFQVGITNSANDRISLTLMQISANGLYGGTLVDFQGLSETQTTFAAIDSAISNVSTFRNALGSKQNRLETTISNLQSMHENLAVANSRIQDTDVASDAAIMAQEQILMQAGISVLSQANQMPSTLLALLG
jgi:flagellin